MRGVYQLRAGCYCGCRFITFIEVGFKIINATTGNVIDRGAYTKYMNCYSSQRFVLASGARGVVVDGGFFSKSLR